MFVVRAAVRGRHRLRPGGQWATTSRPLHSHAVRSSGHAAAGEWSATGQSPDSQRFGKYFTAAPSSGDGHTVFDLISGQSA